MGTRAGGAPTGPLPARGDAAGTGAAMQLHARAGAADEGHRPLADDLQAGLHAGRGEDGEVRLTQVPEHLGPLPLGGGDGVRLLHLEGGDLERRETLAQEGVGVLELVGHRAEHLGPQ